MNKDTQSWSNSNLTEMEELLQKTQQLQRNNAELRNELASLKHQTQWECSCGGTDCEGQKENAALRNDKEILDWMNNNIQAMMFKHKPDGFTWDFRKIIGDAMSKEDKPNA